MPKIVCPKCGATLRVPSTYAKRKGRCPACKRFFPIPPGVAGAPYPETVPAPPGESPSRPSAGRRAVMVAIAAGSAAVLVGLMVLVLVGSGYFRGAPSAPKASWLNGGKELTLDLGHGVTMKFVRVPAGKFLMGSPETEKGRHKDEIQHEVTISKPFYLGATHVTVDQFAAFVKDGGHQTDAEKDGYSYGFEIKDGAIHFKKTAGCSWRHPSFPQQGDHPVVQVSWNDAQAFCAWLSKRSGQAVVLPTGAQWEYACRAGSKTAYPWGDNADDGEGWANGADQSLKKKLPNAPAEQIFFRWDDGFVFTAPVGSFKANALGLYDMIGNAWQWCRDRDGAYEKGATTDPTGANIGDIRVLRGGSWGGIPALCRSASRGRGLADGRLDDVGFRAAVAADVDSK